MIAVKTCLLAVIAGLYASGAHATASEDMQKAQTDLLTRCQLSSWQVEVHIVRNHTTVDRSPTLNAKQNACVDQYIQQRNKPRR